MATKKDSASSAAEKNLFSRIEETKKSIKNAPKIPKGNVMEKNILEEEEKKNNPPPGAPKPGAQGASSQGSGSSAGAPPPPPPPPGEDPVIAMFNAFVMVPTAFYLDHDPDAVMINEMQKKMLATLKPATGLNIKPSWWLYCGALIASGAANVIMVKIMQITEEREKAKRKKEAEEKRAAAAAAQAGENNMDAQRRHPDEGKMTIIIPPNKTGT